MRTSTNSSFIRTASAPASVTASCSAVCLSPVRAITHMLGWSRLRRATADTPSSLGMCRSMTTASGESSSASSIAARPSEAVPTTASCSCRSINGDNVSRNGSSSSASRTRIVPAVFASPIGLEVRLFAVTSQPARHKVAVIGAPLDLGAGRRGVDMGPSAIRYADLAARIAELGHEVVDRGNVETAVAEATTVGDEHARFLPQIKATCERITRLVSSAVRDEFVSIVLGGDHSVALGTLAGLREVHGTGGAIWIDAHGDLNSPDTSPTGNVHGMVLAAALGLAGQRFQESGWGLPALDHGRIALVGVRALDEGERTLLGKLDAKVFTMSDVDRLGVERAVREALAHVAGPGFVHVSLDMEDRKSTRLNSSHITISYAV